MGDLVKIKNWFQWLDTCQYAMLCAFVRVPNDSYIEQLRTEATKAGDQWITGRISRPPGLANNFQPFARILTNIKFRR
jgi:hypothetical protein